MQSQLLTNLCGGLGNQLFQVASSLAFSRDLSLPLHLNISNYKYYTNHPFLVHQLFSNLSYTPHPPRFSIYSLSEKGPGFDPDLLRRMRFLSYLPCGVVPLTGYLQSLSYFVHHLSSISATIISSLDQLFSEEIRCLRDLLSNSLSVHIRRGDKLSSLNQSIYGNLNNPFFRESLLRCFSSSDYTQVLFFGDDPSYLELLSHQLKSDLPSSCFHSLIATNSPLLDLYAFSLSKGLFLSNSTFALWSAYISMSSDIYFPYPFYPSPRHNSVSSHYLEDLVFPHWTSYTSGL